MSLSRLPKDIIIGMVHYLDHKSLVQLAATCSPFQQLVKNDVDGHWKVLHDKNWSSGKLLRFNGPPSQRPRGGIVALDDGRNWREEFMRRVELDKRVPELLSRLKGEDIISAASMIVGEHGADIYDQLRLLSFNPAYE